jgi:hypothetical protein
MQINLDPTSERGASRDAVNCPRETLGDSNLISSDPRSRFGLVCDLLCCRGNSDLTSIDEQTGAIEPLFHPRRDRWVDHFQLVGGRIEPRTAKGRTTTRLLRLNDSDRVEERELLIATGSIREPTA